MTSGRRTIWHALVWVLIPFTLGAGFPQMQCRFAAASGQRWCRCCFPKPGESPTAKPTQEKSCCLQRLAKVNREPSTSQETAAGCQTCQRHANPKSGICCDLKSFDAPTLSKQVQPPAIDITFIGLPNVALRSTLASQCDDLLAGHVSRPTMDRVVVFAHLLI